MTKNDFEKIFQTSLNLQAKKWKFVPLGRGKNNFVSISELGEINFDYLYYDYGHKLWEVNLNQLLDTDDFVITLKEALIITLESHKDYSLDILFKDMPRFKHNHVEVNLNIFGTIIELPNNKKTPIEKDNIAEVIEKAYAKNKIDTFNQDLITNIQKTSKFRGRAKEELLLDKLTADLLDVSEKIYTKDALEILERMAMTITILKKFVNE